MRRILSKDEIDRLVNVNKSLRSTALDIYLLSFFMGGSRFADTLLLTWDSINQDSIRFRMGKTGNPFNIPLLPEAKEIIRKYEHRMGQHKYVFPLMDESITEGLLIRKESTKQNYILNRQLKKIAKDLGMQPFSYHSSRHSPAQYLLSKEKSIYTISKILRHATISVTERYISQLDQELVNKEFAEAFE